MALSGMLRAVDGYQRRNPVLGVPCAVAKRFSEHGAGSLAATIAYYGFFSLFPLFLVLVSVAGFVLRGHADLQQRLLDSALAQFPIVGSQIRGNVGSIQGSGVALVIGLILAVWAGIGGVRAAQVAMDTIWDVPRRSRRRAVGSVGMALGMLVVLGAFLAGGAVLASLGGSSRWIWVAGKLGSALLNVVLFALAYRVLVSSRPTWSTVLPGALLAGAGWTVLLGVGGRLVSNRIASASEMYGTFAIVIGLLGWIYLGSQLTLVGAELNVVLHEGLWPRSLRGPLTPADEQSLWRSAMQEERNDGEHVRVTFGSEPSGRTEGRPMED